MKSRSILASLLMTMLAAAVLAQAARAADPSSTASIVGVWRAQADALPCIALNITNETGELSGAVLFYFHYRQSVDQPWTSTPGLPEPLFHPKFDGQTLTFQVSHRRAHPPGSLNDPPVSFHMKLIAPDKAEFVNGNDPGPVLVLVRADY